MTLMLAAEDSSAPKVPMPRVGNRTRLALSLCVAAATCGLALVFRLVFKQQSSDFDQIVIGARRALAGLSPYSLVALPGLEWPIYYPMPAIVLGLPLAALSIAWAHAVFSGIGAGLFTWAASADGDAKLFGLFTWPFVLTVSLGQWAPLLMASAFLPGLGWLAIAKPNIGAAIAGGYGLGWTRGRTLWLNAAMAGVLMIASFALRPTWLGEWLSVIRQPTPHIITPLTVFGGPLLLLGLVRWREPDARFLAALACVPQTFSSYDAFLLFLVVRTRREALVLVAATTAMTAVVGVIGPAPTYAETVHRFASFRIAIVYLPALAIVLSRPTRHGPLRVGGTRIMWRRSGH
jgi:hypothetical protein